MFTKFLVPIMAALVLVAPGTMAAVPPGSTSPALSLQADALFAPWKRRDVPGMAVIVQRDGKVVYRRGFGMADLEHSSPITTITPFHLASVSKQFTAFAIRLLAQEGKLSLTDDIRKFLPEMYDFGKPITVQHLLHHTSGLRDQWSLLAMAGWRLEDVITETDIFTLVQRQRALNSDPGKEFSYCNTGYTLLAMIVGRVSGMSFPVFAQERIFKPLGMKHTHFQDHYGKLVRNRALSYEPTADGLGYQYLALSYSNVGATSLFSTADDLALWVRNFDTGRVGGKALVEKMQAPGTVGNGRPIAYASGLSHGEYRGLPTIGHGGRDAGFRTVIERYPRQHFSVTLLANGADIDPLELAHKLADIFLADHLASSPRDTLAQTNPIRKTMSPAELDAMSGDFALAKEMVIHFTRRDGRLFAQADGQDALALEPIGERSFLFKAANARIEFDAPGPDGLITSARWIQGGQRQVLKRRPPVFIEDSDRRAFEGEYYSDELHTLYTVSSKKGRLALTHPRGEVDLEPMDSNAFIAAFPIGHLQFQCAPQTGCAGFTVSNDRVRNLQFTRVTIAAATAGDTRRVRDLLPAVAPQQAPPFSSEAVYLRGSMNNWQPRDRLLPDGTGRLTLRLELNKGRHEFKVGSEDFRVIDFGAAFRSETVMPGQSKALESTGENIVLEVMERAIYRFVLDASDPFAPVMLVETVPLPDAAR